MTDSQTDRLRALHQSGTFVIPNPFDRGTARLLAALGAQALATTSSGLAASLGRLDMTISRDDLLRHVGELATATDLPLHVDAERGFAPDAAGVADTVRMLAAAGASGCSIEDWDPATGAIDPLAVSVARVAAAVEAAKDHRLVITARCEHHIRGIDDLDATIERLIAYRDVGAECLYAPGLVDPDQIRRVVQETAGAVNVLLLPGGPSVDELAAIGVRRTSLGGRLYATAYGAAVEVARTVLEGGGVAADLPSLSRSLATEAFGTEA